MAGESMAEGRDCVRLTLRSWAISGCPAGSALVATVSVSVRTTESEARMQLGFSVGDNAWDRSFPLEL